MRCDQLRSAAFVLCCSLQMTQEPLLVLQLDWLRAGSERAEQTHGICYLSDPLLCDGHRCRILLPECQWLRGCQFSGGHCYWRLVCSSQRNAASRRRSHQASHSELRWVSNTGNCSCSKEETTNIWHVTLVLRSTSSGSLALLSLLKFLGHHINFT